ncbi:MAG: addiction module component, family protein [Planctomyces sp.]|nr:addiction module component, family protein [Planctomyces sp.]|tara:strand:+ start:417 stop:653 length:237 start_codon:yes stop_codon:yes gene_type:complete
MARDLKELFSEAADLSENDRATLAGLLIESLDPNPDPEVDRAWADEIARRVEEMDAGTVETIPWEKVRAELIARRDDD